MKIACRQTSTSDETALQIKGNVMKEIAIKLRRAEISDLLQLVEERIREGSYYAPKNQYYARRDGLKVKLETALKEIA